MSQPFMYFNLFSTGCAAACGWLRGGASLLALPGFHVFFIFWGVKRTGKVSQTVAIL